jgi:hypothetical protein
MQRSHTSNRIRFGRETPNWVTRPTSTCDGKRGHTVGAGEDRLAGQCRVVLLQLSSNGSPPEKKPISENEKFRQHLPCTGRLPNLQKKTARWPTTTNTSPARWPTSTRIYASINTISITTTSTITTHTTTTTPTTPSPNPSTTTTYYTYNYYYYSNYYYTYY